MPELLVQTVLRWSQPVLKYFELKVSHIRETKNQLGKNPNRKRIRVAGALFNENRVSRMLGQTASRHRLLRPRKLTSCAHIHNSMRSQSSSLGSHTNRLTKKTSIISHQSHQYCEHHDDGLISRCPDRAANAVQTPGPGRRRLL